MSLDEILAAESQRLAADPYWYPLIPNRPVERHCPDHPDETLAMGRGHYSYECPACRTKVCVRCGRTEHMAWFSPLCRPCQDVQQVHERARMAKQRRDELDHARRAESIAVALEQDGAELRRLLRWLHRPSPDQEGVKFTGSDSAEEVVVCWSCCTEYPCRTRLIVDDDDEVADELRAEIERGADQ